MAMANLANQQQAEMANQALAGQYGLQQGSYNVILPIRFYSLSKDNFIL
jgi:hypothetical protein